MTDLKTLKDIAYNDYEDSEVRVGDLRKEAIKWVKKPSVLEPPEAAKWRATPWIINFFNITEEDIDELDNGKDK